MAEDTPFVRGAARLSRRIATIRENLALPKLTQEIGALLLRRTLQRFDRQVTPDNVPWPDLKEATTAAKRRLGYGKGAILVRTGTFAIRSSSFAAVRVLHTLLLARGCGSASLIARSPSMVRPITSDLAECQCVGSSV